MSAETEYRAWTLIFLLVVAPDLVVADEFPKVYNSEPNADAAPMPADEAAAKISVPDGFHVSVFASEPMVQNPIGMSWDARGRLWIAENYTYAERSQKFDLSLRDRVVILEDENGDGRADKRTVFTDQVQMLTSVEVGRGGVWLMCPPRLLFIPDRDRDGSPDGPAVVVLDGFDVAQENYHNFANGLRFGPDGWLYGRCGGSCPGRVGPPGAAKEDRVALEGGVWRYSPDQARFEVLVHGTTNPWGHDWNSMGEGFFINTVNGHLWHLIPGAHFVRPFTLDPNPHVYELIDMHADHWHFDTKGSWTKSRDGAANEYGGGHAHVGMMIYQGDNWPEEYRGRLLTWNIHGRRANQEILERRGSGYVAKHAKDLFLSADPFFRGMELSAGPDGAVYAIDWSDTGECHEHTGVHRTSGRVYKIAYGKSEKVQTEDLQKLSTAQLAEFATHSNAWRPRQAQIIFAERAASSSFRLQAQAAWRRLWAMVQQSKPETAIRALGMLHSAGQTGRLELEKLLRHKDEHVRAQAIRLLTDTYPLDDVFGPNALSKRARGRVLRDSASLMPEFRRLAREDESGLVRLTLASTLQRLPLVYRSSLAMHLVSREEDRDDHNLPLLVWYGVEPLADEAPSRLVAVATRCRWPKTQRLIVRRLAEIIDDNPRHIDGILRHALRANAQTQMNIMRGLTDGLKGWTKAPEPEVWKQFAAAVHDHNDPEMSSFARDLSVLFGDGRALDEVRSIVLDKDAEISLRRSALGTLVATGGEEVHAICLSLLSDARLNTVAARGLAKSRDPKTALALIKNYRRFRAPQRGRVIEILVSRPEFAEALLDAVEQRKIPATDLSAYDIRQIGSLGLESLTRRVGELWGAVRVSPEEKRNRIESLKAKLTTKGLTSANPGRGRALFNRTCAKCHKLFGVGEKIGPDLTGANRSNLDYLLQNVLDPSAVVSKDYRMTIVHTSDGRVLNGLVLAKNDKTLTLQTQADKVTISLEDVAETKLTSESPMPSGLFDNLTEQQLFDLVSYLTQPIQVPLAPDPNESN